jgi:Tol biopolymer transport system component
MPPETVEIPYRKRPSFSIEAERGLWRLTYGSGNNIGAVWSPDGSKIAYTSDRFGNWTLHVINVESGDEVQLTSPDSISGWPDWSPDGDRIAYWSYRNDESQLYTIKSDGTDEQQLTSGSLLKSEPLWKSDGTMLLFGQKDEYWQIWIMALNSGKQWQVSTADEDHWAPRWMPDGREIIYYSSDGFILKTVNIESLRYRYVTSVPSGELVSDERPRINPDGKKMLFSSIRSPNWGLWLMDIDGKNTERITHDGAGDRKASWSSDGKKIIYSSYRSGNSDIWLMNSDGSNQTRLIKSRFDEFEPSLHPSGSIVAYESNIGGKFDIWILEIDSPLDVDVNFQKYPYQNSSSETKLEFSSRVKGIFQIESVRLHFDWQSSGVDNEIIFTPPVQLTLPSTKEARSISFEIPTDATLGYHFYNLIVEYRQVVDGSDGLLRTYRHTAKDISVAPQERNIYENLHEKVASEIEIQNSKAQEEGYSDLLVEANQIFLLAERLALEDKLTEATEQLRLTESLLKQNLPEEKPAYSIVTIGVIGAILFAAIVLVYAVRRIRTSKVKNS